jgi:hypothetical protein
MPSLSVIWYVYSQCKTELVMDRLQLTRLLPGSHKHRDNYLPMLSQLLDSQTNHRCSDINLEHFLTCRCFELLLCQASGFFCEAAGWCVSVVTSVDWLIGWFVGCYTNWFIRRHENPFRDIHLPTRLSICWRFPRKFAQKTKWLFSF